jgi:sarcosine oxidase delta subunit
MTFYKCPYCNFVVSVIERQFARYDYLCPRCGEKKFSEFLYVDENNSISPLTTREN